MTTMTPMTRMWLTRCSGAPGPVPALRVVAASCGSLHAAGDVVARALYLAPDAASWRLASWLALGEAVAAASTPVEESTGDARATVAARPDDGTGVVWTTPGGVEVWLCLDDAARDEWVVRVFFGRASTVLASELAARAADMGVAWDAAQDADA